MTSKRSKNNRRNRKRHTLSNQGQMSIVNYPMQVPVPPHFKEQLRVFHGETPRSLFKFERPDRERFAALNEGVAYFSTPYRFNDTQDCRSAIDGSLAKEELDSAISPENKWLTAALPSYTPQTSPSQVIADAEAHLSIAYFKTIEKERKIGVRRLRRSINQLADIFTSPIQSGGICCFTDSWSNELMWEKYARSGSGFVLEFDSQKCAICWDASPVDYVEALPMIRLFSSAMAGTVWKDTLRLLLTKLREPWWQEREWRTWRKIPGFYRYAPDSLISVTFGPNIEDELANALVAIVGLKYWPGTHVYEAKSINGKIVRVPVL